MSANDNLIKVQIFRYICEHYRIDNRDIVSYVELSGDFGGHYDSEKIKQYCHDIATDTDFIITDGKTVKLTLKGKTFANSTYNNFSDYETLVAYSKDGYVEEETVEAEIYEPKKSKIWTIKNEVYMAVGFVAGIIAILKFAGVI